MTGLLVLLGGIGLPAAVDAAPPATATAAPRFGIGTVGNYPQGYFTMSLAPGETGQFAAAVVNFGEAPADLKVYAANAVNPANGGFAATDETIKPAGSTTWLTLTATSFTLAAGAQQAIPFTITVPNGTAPGQYITALVASTAGAVPVPGSATFTQIIRSTLPVEITVPGPVKPGFTLGHPAFVSKMTGARLEIPVSNTGNVLVKPAGQLTVTASNGNPALSVPIKMQSVYAGLSTSIELNLPARFQPGRYTISLTLKDPATGATALIANDKATLTPPQAVATPTSPGQ